jgi:hypothetical protein
MLLIGVSAYSQDSQAVTYNAIATAYVTTTISQQVVFDSNMQQGGTFTMSVLAHNGGGRAGQSDTANVKIQFYTSTGSLVTSVNSTNSGNLPNPNAVCGNPCIDTSVPWSTLTISASLTAAQAATVAYATVSMYGIDGSYWAGDYGPWYRAPTFQLNGGGNLLYNPEFGPYNNITAQGWVSSPGFGACQGAWGGSNACIVNSDGVPGSSTVGLVANANGGGPSATGGTTSGTPGGYNNTMSVTNAGTGATAGAAPAAPTVTSTTTSYTYRSVVTGNTTRVYRTLVTTTNYSDNTSTTSTGTEELYYTAVVTTSEVNGIVGGGLATTVTTTTTTTYNNGSQTVSSSNSYVYYGTINQTNAPGDQTVSSGGYYTPPTDSVTKQTRVDTWRNSTQLYNNELFIEQVYGSNNNVTITQTGDKNRIDFTLSGNGNIVNSTQTGRNYLKEEVPGWGNNINTSQTNTAGGSNYAETKIQGNGNTINHTQSGTGNHILFSKVTGDINTVTTTQTGSAGHIADVTLTGNHNSVLVDQSGSTQNKANINLTNNGGPASLDLQQTGGKSFTIIQSCVNPAGCSTVVRQ